MDDDFPRAWIYYNLMWFFILFFFSCISLSEFDTRNKKNIKHKHSHKHTVQVVVGGGLGGEASEAN